eukprot:5149933-Alexandrium_andersonii.AAC.1
MEGVVPCFRNADLLQPPPQALRHLRGREPTEGLLADVLRQVPHHEAVDRADPARPPGAAALTHQ